MSFFTNIKGMTLRQYAAIKLKLPDSGTDWLDEMIETSLRNDLAAKAMQGELSAMELDGSGSSGLPIGISEDMLDELANHWFRIGRAMLKARNK